MEPEVLYRKGTNGSVIDSAMYEENGEYYCFLKSEKDPSRIILVKGKDITGPFNRVHKFDECMDDLTEGLYETPTAVKLEDGRWCLFLDFYGCEAEEQGYVPFVADSLSEANFVRSDEAFEFPYGYKHGTILTITMDEYERLKSYKKMPSER